jgi:hypothetical protein
MTETHPAAVLVRESATSGLPPCQLRRVTWRRVSRGLYIPRAETNLADLAAALALVLPRASGFGHLTSAALRGWWLPHRLPPHVLLATTRSGVHVQRAGLYVRRSRVAEVEEVGGVLCVTAAHTLVELASDLSLLDLVPCVDRALADGVTEDQVRAALGRRARGAVTLRKALALADPRSESWWESVLRLQHVVTGLGPVECQPEIWADGVFVARADLHLVGTSRYPECDGGEHRDRTRHAHDLARDKAMARLRLERYGYTTSEIAYRPQLVIRDAEDARGLPHDDARLRTWWQLARPSSLTGSGRTRLAARLERYRLAAHR